MTVTVPADAVPPAPAGPVRLFTQEFDEDFTRTAPGFVANDWAGDNGQKPTYVLSKGTGAIGGAQRFRVENRPEGSDVHLVNPHRFARGQAYRIQFMARAERATKLDLFLRRDEVRPFMVDASKTVDVTTEWQNFAFQGTYRWADPGSFRMALKDTGVDVFVDRYAVFRVTDSDSVSPIDVPVGVDGAERTTDKHLDFEEMPYTHDRFARGWNVNDPSGNWDAFEAGPETRAGYAVDGRTSQRFMRKTFTQDGRQVESKAELYYSFDCQRGRKYRIAAHMRADRGQTAVPVQLGVRRAPAPYSFLTVRNLKLGEAWQPVEMEVVCVQRAGTGVHLRLNVREVGKNVYIDALTVSEVHDNPWTPYGTGMVPDSLPGMHTKWIHDPQWQWPALGQHVVRLWDSGTKWLNLEKDQDVWPWQDGEYGKRLDVTYMKKLIQIRNSADPKLKIIYTMGQTPQWASSKPDDPDFAAAPPRDDADWEDYVRTLATRYKGEIDVYELWNEPDHRAFYTGTPEDLARLAEKTRRILNEVDPEAVLISPGITTNGIDWLDRFLAAGGKNAVQGIGFHWYFGMDPENVGYVDNLRDVMRRHGVGHLKLWNTEGSSSNCVGGVGPCLDGKVAVCLEEGACDAAFCSAAPGNCRVINDVERRSAVARALFLMAGRGVENFDFYTLEGGYDAELLENAQASDFTTPSQEGEGYAAATQWLRGAKVTASHVITDDVYVLRIQQGAQSSSILWTTGVPVRVRLPQEWSPRVATTLAGAQSAIPANREFVLGLEPVKITS